MLDSERVAQLRAQGHSLREIAAKLGASLGAVQRALKRRPVSPTAYLDVVADVGDDDEEEGGLALLDGTAAERVLTPPFRFTGMETETVTVDHDDPRSVLEPRFVDSAGRSCDVLDLWRFEFRDGSAGDGTLSDAMCQIEAAGYRRVVDPQAGRWHWAPAPAG
jgi:hypothetical protein